MMVEGMGANLESQTQSPKLVSRHCLALGGLWHVKCPAQTMLGKKFGHAQIQRMAIVPTGRDVGLRLHDNPP
jgi:hypothetical protein